MAISPKPSDYVSQVRAYLDDLRRDQQQTAQLGLQYAQLAQQRNLAQLQADVQREQIQQAYASKFMDAEAAAIRNQVEAVKKQNAEDLAQKRFELDVAKYEEDKREKEQSRFADYESRYALQKLNDYVASNDPEGYSKWTQDMSKMAFFNANLGKVMSDGLTLWNNSEAIRKNNIALQEMPTYTSLLSDAQTLKTQLPFMSKDQRIAALADWDKKAGAFKVKVPNEQMISSLDQNNEAFKLLLKELDGRENLQKIETFSTLGRNQQLKNAGPGFEEIQGKFNELYNSTPVAEQNTPDFQRKINDLRLAFNLKKSEAFLASEATRLRAFEEAQLDRPELTLTDESGNVFPKLRAPDLSPNALIGNLNDDNEPSALVLEKIKDFTSKGSQQGLLIERMDPNAGMLAMVERIEAMRQGKPAPTAPTTPAGTPSAQVDRSKVKFSNPWAMPQTATAATPTQPAPATAAAPAKVPSANINDLEANRALYAEVQRQLKEGKKYLEVTNPQTGEIKLTQLSLATLNSTLPGLIRNLEQSALAGNPPEERR